MSGNDDYATGNLLDNLYHQNFYELICRDLSRQKNSNFPQEIDFKGILEKNYGLTMFLLLKSSKKLF